MFPGGVNPKQMANLMKQMGMKNGEVKATRVIIEEEGGKTLVFTHPQVQWIEMQGTKTYTVIGKPVEQLEIPTDDIAMVVEQTGATHAHAKKALEESNGDIAEAILKLKK